MAKCVPRIPTVVSWHRFPGAACRSSELGHTDPRHELPCRLPGPGGGASLSAPAEICKTSSQTPRARPGLTRSCGLLLTSAGFASVAWWVSMELLLIYISEGVSWPQEAPDIAGALPADARGTACYLTECPKI